MPFIVWLTLSIIPVTYCSLTEDILEHVDRQSAGECPIPTAISDEHCDTESRNGAYVSMTHCTGYSYEGEVVPLVCSDGLWISRKTTDSNDVNHRKKRFFIFCIFIIAVICLFTCRRRKKVDNPPVIHNCPSGREIVADEGTTTAKATWGRVSCTDDKGKCENGPYSGSTFHRDTTIRYTATDSSNKRTYCSFTIKLKVITCSLLSYPTRSTRTCSPQNFIYGDGFIYGTTCNFTCEPGYELHGNSSLTCEANGEYSGTIPTCEAIKCPRTQEVKNGHAQCSDPTFVFNTACFLRCDDGYTPANVSLLTIQCKEDRTWSSAFQDCVDSEPPEILCPDNLIAFAERSISYANVSWDEPQVQDNSGGDIRLNYTAEFSNGDMAPVGEHEITYSAEDETGNTALCSFFVTVIVRTCDPPRLADKYLLHDCSNDFGYGQSCSLSCVYGYPINGSSMITCEKNETDTEPRGYWHWNSTEEPQCIVKECTPLEPPRNGALACSSAGVVKFCQMLCNHKFDIPRTVNPVDLIVCDNKGIWNPIQQVPDCTEKRIPGSMNLPGDMFYFTEDCDNQTAQDEIKNNFINFAEEQSSQGWGNLCPNSTCTVQDIEVFCGPTRRRKRYAHPRLKRTIFGFSILKFVINMPWVDRENDGYEYNLELIEKIGSVITNASASGELDYAGLSPGYVSFGIGEMNCPKGQTPRYSTGSCAGCPTGTFNENITDECTSCPKGSYQDEAFQNECKQCPDGMSTEAEGAKNDTSCIELCPSGYYSSYGTRPCSPCAVGYYQPSGGSTECLRCPNETVTDLTGRTKITECKSYDIRFESDDIMSLGSLPPSTLLIVSSFWLKFPSYKDNDEWFSYSDSISSLTFGDAVYFEGKRINNANTTRYSSWINVLVETDLYMNTTNLFIDEKEVVLDNVASGSPAEVTFRGSENTVLSSFVLAKTKRERGTVKNTTRCKSNHADVVFNMDTLQSLDSTFLTTQTPSRCDPVDECLTFPCGTHECTNLLGGYKCRCFDGFTGTNCDTPPNYCKENDCSNGSTCKSGLFSYTCECGDGYRGPLCDIKIVNGNWSDWMEWSSCTQTCDGGTRYRERYCDNPPANPDGEQCNGESNQTEACNQQNCPSKYSSCPPIDSIQQYGNIFNCTEMDGLSNCSVQCQSGLTFVDGHEALEQYICGGMTQYEWNATPPSCSKAKSPEKIETHTNGEYDSFPCSSVGVATTLLNENIQGLQCVVNKTCQGVVSISGCSDNTRDKRETKTAVVDISLTTTLEGGDNLKLEEFFESNIVSPALQDFIHALVDIETSLQQMNSSQPFRFESQGIQYNAESVGIDVTLTCEPGSVQSYGLCVDCPTGSKQVLDQCVMCEIGYYQDENGQTECKLCPSGYTTFFVGSGNHTDCKVHCPAGSRKELDQCVMCEVGYYQDENGQTECKPCPTGFTTAFAGSRNHTDCKAISADIDSTTIPTESTEIGETLVIALSVVGTLIVITSAVIFSYVFRKYINRREKYQVQQ